MSLFDMIDEEVPQIPLESAEDSKPAKKGRKSSAKKEEVQEVTEGNPYLVDMDEFMKSHKVEMIPPRPEEYSFEAVAEKKEQVLTKDSSGRTVTIVKDMAWIRGTEIVPFAPESEDVQVQKQTLKTFIEDLVGESSTLAKEVLPDYFVHETPKPLIAYDLETTGLNTTIRYKDGVLDRKVKIAGVSLATSSRKAYYMPVNHNCLDGILNWSEEAIIPFLTEVFDRFITISHNGQFDREVSAINGVEIKQDNRYIDTLIIAHLFDNNSKQNGLKRLSDVYLNRPQIETTALFPDTISMSFARLSLTDSYVYAGLDTLNTYALFEFFLNHPTDNVFAQQPIPLTVDLKMCDVVRAMYRVGLPINLDYAVKAALDLIVRRKLLLEEIDRFVGRKVDVGSTQQLSKLLFEDYKIPTDGVPKGKSGFYSTSEDVLDMLFEKYPNYTILKYVVTLRKLGNSLVKYCVKMINNSFCCDAMPYLHSQLKYSLTNIPTGRLSSSSDKGRDMVTTKTSAKTGRISYSYIQGACSCGLNSQGLDSRQFGEYEAEECFELPPESQIGSFPNPNDYMDELIKYCSEG